MLVNGFMELLFWVQMALLAGSVVAFVHAAVQREDAYRAAGKQNKAMWLLFLGIAAVIMGLFPLDTFLPALGLVAVIVYAVDVRPALAQVAGRGRGPRRRGSSSDGPYGPFNGGF
ncbi:DUF2516 family protein [Streptomyces sp. NPDC059740]|uniref:DUF2516 family protein n=1 Tax=Streptomyces sp. NPDC059740 TaxID=3346926 RepID=UPI00365E1719